MFSTNGKQIIVFCFKLALFYFDEISGTAETKKNMKELYFCKCLNLVLGLNVGLEDPVSCCRVTETVIQLCSINDYVYYTVSGFTLNQQFWDYLLYYLSMTNPREIFRSEQRVGMNPTTDHLWNWATQLHGAVISPGFVTLQAYTNNSIWFGKWSFISE